MKTQVNLGISVTTDANMSGEDIARIVQRLLDSGLADAQATADSGEGDMDAAELAAALNISAPVVMPSETSVKVKHWDAYHVDGTTETHRFDIDDQRESNGQAFISISSLDGLPDDMLSVTMEVNANPLNGTDHVPCAHLHFDSDSLAVSLYKVGNRILVRPETNVSIQSFFQKVNGFGEELYWIA